MDGLKRPKLGLVCTQERYRFRLLKKTLLELAGSSPWCFGPWIVLQVLKEATMTEAEKIGENSTTLCKLEATVFYLFFIFFLVGGDVREDFPPDSWKL